MLGSCLGGAMEQILLIGYRQGLADALTRSGLPFTVWSSKELKTKQRHFSVFQHPFPETPQGIRHALSLLNAYGPFFHVLAGSERSIPLVAIARKYFDCARGPAIRWLRCHDKWLMKSYLAEHAVPMTDMVLHRPQLAAQDLMQRLGPTVVCKDRCESGGRSVVFCKDLADLEQNMGRKRLYERFIDAPEYSIESFVQNGQIIFRNVTFYYRKKHVNLLPAKLPSDREEEFASLNQRVIRALGIHNGLAHLEVYLTPQGPLFGEIALRPPGGYIMDLLEIAYGFSAWDAYLAIELGQALTLPQKAKCWAAAQVLHPGAGEILKIEGWKATLRHPQVVRAKLKVEAGDHLTERIGVGEDVGYILLAADRYEELTASIEHSLSMLQFRMDQTLQA